MAKGLEVRVPDDIREYKESLIAGLSVRQLLCGGIALLCGVPTFFLLKNINEDLALYSTMIVVIPAFLVGFIKKDGYNFETYFKIHLSAFLGHSTRYYETNPCLELPIETEEYRKQRQKEIKEEAETELKKDKKGSEKNVPAKNKKRSIETRRTEHEFIAVTAKSIKRKRKTTAKKLEITARKFRTKKRKQKEKAKIGISTEELPTNT